MVRRRPLSWAKSWAGAVAAMLIGSAGAEAQSCVPSSLPGPALIQTDLSDLRGVVELGADGLVREAGQSVLWPVEESGGVEVFGRFIRLPERIERGVVWCANSIIAYPTADTSLRLVHVETGQSRDFEIPLAHASFDQMSDGTFWYRIRADEPGPRGVEWYRLDLERGQDTVFTPRDSRLLDAYGDRVLVGARALNADGGRSARIIVIR